MVASTHPYSKPGRSTRFWRVISSTIALVVAVSLLLPLTAHAQLVPLAPSADTYLRSGSANQNQGADGFLRLQSSGNNRALLRVPTADLTAAVGTGRLVTATLELYIQSNGDNWGSDGRTVDVHRLLADWSEAGATWNCGIDANPGNSHRRLRPAVGRRHLRRRAHRHGAPQQRPDRLGGLRRHRGRGGLPRRRAELRLAAQEDRGEPERQGGLHLQARGRPVSGRSWSCSSRAPTTTWCRRALRSSSRTSRSSSTRPARPSPSPSPTAARGSTPPALAVAWMARRSSGCSVTADRRHLHGTGAGRRRAHRPRRGERPRRQPGAADFTFELLVGPG